VSQSSYHAALPLQAVVTELRTKMAGTGHDLMQPLQIVTHALQRMDGTCLNERDRMWLEAAMVQTERIAGGLSDLIVQSTASSDAELRQVQLEPLFAEVARAWSATAALQGVGLRVRPAAGSVTSDHARLRSIIDNLIANAIKYSPAGRVLVGLRRRRGETVIDVVDNGCGIAEENRERVFAAFCQISSAAQGVGLGLSLVRDHCRALGHRVELASILGRGSRFSVYLGDSLVAPAF
jgi:signal transduction histidine kinase